MKKAFFKSSRKTFIYSFILLLFLGISETTEAFQDINEQDSYLEYKGLVIDSKSKKPLVYADLNIKGTNIRSITNKEGVFLLKVPKDHLDKKVIISYLGYKTKQVLLSDFKKENTKITLDILVTKLTEINLNSVKDAKQLFLNALKNKGENYYGNEAIMTSFYRESIKKGRKNASLSEAVIEIYKQPTKSSRKDILKLVKSRKNTNYSKLDTLALKLQGGPFSALHTDLMKYPEYIFTEETLVYYDFEFETISQIDNRQVYVINFKQQENVLSPFYFGKLYIDVSSLALLRADYRLNVSDKKLASAMFVRKKPKKVTANPLEAAYRVDYRVKNGKWYYGYSHIHLIFKVKWKGRLFNNTYALNSEMVITDWKQNTTGAKPKLKESLKLSDILIDQASGFSDPDFWGEYNIIEPEKSIETAIKKISKQLDKLKS